MTVTFEIIHRLTLTDHAAQDEDSGITVTGTRGGQGTDADYEDTTRVRERHGLVKCGSQTIERWQRKTG